MSLIPRWYSHLPRPKRRTSDLFNLRQFFEEFDDQLAPVTASGLSVSSDDKNVYIEAHVPGLSAKDIEVSVDEDNVLWIKGEKKEEAEDKKRKFYRRSQTSFAYCVPLWEELDTSSEPEATVKEGVIKITFPKRKEKQKPTKKIKVKE